MLDRRNPARILLAEENPSNATLGHYPNRTIIHERDMLHGVGDAFWQVLPTLTSVSSLTNKGDRDVRNLRTVRTRSSVCPPVDVCAAAVHRDGDAVTGVGYRRQYRDLQLYGRHSDALAPCAAS